MKNLKDYIKNLSESKPGKFIPDEIIKYITGIYDKTSKSSNIHIALSDLVDDAFHETDGFEGVNICGWSGDKLPEHQTTDLLGRVFSNDVAAFWFCNPDKDLFFEFTSDSIIIYRNGKVTYEEGIYNDIEFDDGKGGCYYYDGEDWKREFIKEVMSKTAGDTVKNLLDILYDQIDDKYKDYIGIAALPSTFVCLTGW